MAKRSVRRRVRNIDPIFFIPEGVDELTYDEDKSDAIQYAEGIQEASEIIFEDEAGSVDISDRPPAPQILGIAKQTVRTLANGDERVDVVLLVEDIPGADKFEFRISKA